MRERAPHVATLGLQRREIREWLGIKDYVFRIWELCLYTEHLRLPLRQTGGPHVRARRDHYTGDASFLPGS